MGSIQFEVIICKEVRTYLILMYVFIYLEGYSLDEGKPRQGIPEINAGKQIHWGEILYCIFMYINWKKKLTWDPLIPIEKSRATYRTSKHKTSQDSVLASSILDSGVWGFEYYYSTESEWVLSLPKQKIRSSIREWENWKGLVWRRKLWRTYDCIP